MVDSFLENVDREVSARGARPATSVQPQRREMDLRAQIAALPPEVKGMALGSLVAGLPLSLLTLSLADYNGTIGGQRFEGLLVIWLVILVINLAWAGWHRQQRQPSADDGNPADRAG